MAEAEPEQSIMDGSISSTPRTTEPFFTRTDLAPSLLLTIAVLLFFSPMLLSGKIFFYRDVIYNTYPLSAIVKESFNEGTLPLLNPYVGFGQPLLTNPDAEVAYPTTILRLLMSPARAFTWHVILHAWWGALGMYLLCRRFKISPIASLLGGLGFIFAGPFVSYQNLVIAVASAAWMPWAFLTLDRALAAWSARRAALFGAMLGMQFLACEAVTCMQTVTLCFLYAAAIYGNWRKPLAKENREIVTTFFIAGITSMLLSAVYLLPFLRYVSLGRRGGGMSSFEANQQSLHPLLLVDLIAPNIFMFNPYTAGNANLWLKVLNNGVSPFLLSIYLGSAQLGLAVLGACWRGERRRKFFTIILIATLLLALGSTLHLFDLLRFVMPLFRVMRYPVKFLLISSFALSLLAAYGLDQFRLQDQATQAARRYGLVIILALALLLLLPVLYCSTMPAAAYQSVQLLAARLGIDTTIEAADQLWPILRGQLLRALLLLLLPILAAIKISNEKRALIKPMMMLLLVIALGDLAQATMKANLTVSEQVATFQPDLVRYFPESKSDYRVYSPIGAQVQIDLPEFPPDQRDGEKRILYVRNLLYPYDNINYHIYTGIDLDKPGLYPYQYTQLQNFIEHQGSIGLLLPMLARFNIRFIVSQYPLPSQPGLIPFAAAGNFSTVPTSIYQLEHYLPQTYIANSERYLPAGDETLALLCDSKLPEREIILNDEQAPIINRANSRESIGQSKVIGRTLRSLTISSELVKPGYLLVNESYMPGWRVKVDGSSAAYYRANQLFIAIPLAAGKHQIELSYLPSEFIIGATLSLLSLIGGLIWAVKKR